MIIKGKFFYSKIFCLIIFSSLFILSKNYVLIQLKKFENESISNNKEFTPETLINNLFNKYYTFLNVGFPPQKTEAQLSTQEVGLTMEENICLTSNYYDKNKSLSLNQTHSFDKDNFSLKKVVVNETIDFSYYNATTKEISQITIPDYIFMYNKSKSTRKEGEEEKIEKEVAAKACFFFGFRIQCERNAVFCKSIPTFLKEANITNSYNFNFLFYDNNNNEKNKNDYDASILIGENPHEYNKEKYSLINYITTRTLDYYKEPSWLLEFQNYYYTENGTKIIFRLHNLKVEIKAIFWFHLEYIIGIRDYYLSIKDNYFDNYEKECNENLVNSNYTVFTCDKNFNTDKFPTLYFYNEEYDFTFELTHKDLFKVIGDKKYFLIIFDKSSNYPWKFGKLFMKKYFFNFDFDQKLIGFYKDLNNNSNENEKSRQNLSVFLWILWTVLLILTGIGCFLLGKFLYNKNRKKRANELDDDYEYHQKQTQENLNKDFNDNKLGIN